MSVHHVYMVPMKDRVGLKLHGTGAIDSCKHSCGGVGIKPRFFQEQKTFLITEASLSLSIDLIYDVNQESSFILLLIDIQFFKY